MNEKRYIFFAFFGQIFDICKKFCVLCFGDVGTFNQQFLTSTFDKNIPSIYMILAKSFTQFYSSYIW